MLVDIYRVGNTSGYVAVRKGEVPASAPGKELQLVKSVDTDDTGRIGIDMPKLVADIEAHGFHEWRVEIRFTEQ